MPLRKFGTMKYPRMVNVWKKMPKRRLSRELAFFLLLGFAMGKTAKRILLVDSNDASRENLRLLMQGLGHEVFEATTGPDAINKASNIHPDLIMMDVRLPGMHGDEVTIRLKKNISTRSIPVVINSGWTTAFNSEDRIDRALNAGAAEILYKPFQLPILRDVLRNYLSA